MTFEVHLQSRAKIQLYNAALWWAEHHSSDQAIRWLEGFQAALRTLSRNPERWPFAPEQGCVPFDVRELTYGVGRRKTHRAVFEIRGQAVVVHAIRHLAQDTLTSDDFA